MTSEALESKNVSFVGHTDLNGKPAFKIAIEQIDDRWYLYLGHLYVSGWSIVDVTDPATPELVNFIEGPENTMTKQIQVADDLMITSVEAPKEGYGLVGEERMDPSKPYTEGAYIFDMSDDPFDPELVGHYETGGSGTHRNFYTGGDYAYMCATPPEFAETDPRRNFMLVVLDVSDPGNPTEVSRWWWPGQSKHDEAEAEESFYFHGPAYVEDDRAHLSYGRVGPVTLDVSDPEDPDYVCRMPIGEGIGSWVGVHSVVPVPGTNFLSVNSEVNVEDSPLEPGGQALNFVYLVDASEEQEPEFKSTGEAVGYKVISAMPLPSPESGLPYDNYYEKPGRFGPHNQHHPRNEDTRLHSSDLLFTAYFNAGLRVFDISDPLDPVEAGYYVPENPPAHVGSRLSEGPVSQFEDVAVDARGYIYCSDATHGLFVLESSLV